MAKPQRILLGVSGGIAAYKACELLRCLQKAGFDVRVLMTEAATRFVGPVTFEALSGHPVATGLFDDPTGAIPHITLAQDCDLMLIAPASADALAKIAHGIADDLLSTTALALPQATPLIVAPAMNDHMYENPATQANLQTLRERGVTVIDAASGDLACGDRGVGRLPEPKAIARFVTALLAHRSRDLVGRRVLITAGPTQEPIDVVRFISNHSSGKMGYGLAEAALERGAEVTLVSGPVALRPPTGVRVVPVTTAVEMLDAVAEAFSESHVAVFTAAVADFRPVKAATTKLKKGRDDERLAMVELEANPDILATMAERKSHDQVVVGFAAEIDDVIENAQAKLVAKGADMIVANRVGDHVGFGVDDDEAALVTASGVEALPLMPKRDLADRILDAALHLLEEAEGY